MTLSQMRHLANDWNLDGAAAPNDDAIQNASRIIEAINRPVDYIHPSVEEGILIHFLNGHFGAFIECYNDGDIGYTLTHYGKSVSSKDLSSKTVSPLEFIGEIQVHLGTEKGHIQVG